MKQALPAAALAFFMVSGIAFAGSVRPVVVELYTSQGCSSCPSADALLAKLAKRKGIIALSLPITYWDILGWKDTLASESNTRRQKTYAEIMGRGGVYTPQIIVDGVTNVVGSRTGDVEAAIATAGAARKHAGAKDNAAWTVGIDLTRSAKGLRIAIGPAPDGIPKSKTDATVWVLALRDSVTVHIDGGENRGRTLTYRNVVSEIRAVGKWHGDAVSFEIAGGGVSVPPQDGVAVLVQQNGYGRVMGAATLGNAARTAW